MRLIKTFFTFLVFLALAALVLSAVAPTIQKVEKSVIINASPHQVYGQMMLLQNFNAWSVWGNADSTIKYMKDGKDGVVGAKISWEGSPFIAGKGEILLTGLKQDSMITHQVDLQEPTPMRAHSKFELIPVGENTRVQWTFGVPAKRPFNIVNLFYSLKKERGKDFETGLSALKLMIENAPLSDPAALKVIPSYFPFTNYAGIKQTVLWVDYPVFFQQHFDHLNRYVLNGKFPTAVKTGLIFDKDNQLHQSNLAAAFPLPAGFKPELTPPEQFIEIGASKSVEVTFYGKEDIKKQAYKALDQYVADKKLKLKKPVIEQYPDNDSLPQTRIIYLVE